MDRPELVQIRESVTQAFKDAGIHLVAERLVEAVSSSMFDILMEDRRKSANMVQTAAEMYGVLDEEQLLRLAVVIAERVEDEDGNAHYIPHEDP